MGQAIFNGDRFDVYIGARQEKCDGDEIIAAGIGVDDHGAAQRSRMLRLGGDSARRKKHKNRQKKYE
jgi:hypothetical protein